MADITLEVDLTDEWKELTHSLSLQAGKTYLVDAIHLSAGIIFSAKTDSSSVAPNVTGHPWTPRGDGTVRQRRLPIKTGEYIWARIVNDTCKLVLTRE